MVRLSERVVRVRAPNPGPMTLDGTNSYVIQVGDGEAVVIDPGPAIDAHVLELSTTARDLGAHVLAILVTHGHPDHAPGAAALSALVDAPVLAHPNAEFPHDQELPGGTLLSYANASLDAIDAPGHSFDHLVFYLREERALFTGDVVLGRGTVVIRPPDGAMRPYQRTLERLARDYPDAERIYGGHGPEVDDPQAKLAEYIEHRRERERQLIGALERGPATVEALVHAIYTDLDPALVPAAGAQMRAYLIALEQEGRVREAGREYALLPG